MVAIVIIFGSETLQMQHLYDLKALSCHGRGGVPQHQHKRIKQIFNRPHAVVALRHTKQALTARPVRTQRPLQTLKIT
jgi:hypothetical protein